MATNKLILHGGGEHARVVLDCALAQGLHVVSIFDPKFKDGDLYGTPFRGNYAPNSDPDAAAVVAIGENALRKRVVEKTVHPFINVIHPSALRSAFSTLGVGNMILHGTIIQAGATLGNHVIVNTGAQVDHDCVIGNYVHVGPGVILCGAVQVGEGTFLGAGSTVIPGKKIGAWVKIGAGSVVINDVPDYAVVVGNPGRILKYTTR